MTTNAVVAEQILAVANALGASNGVGNITAVITAVSNLKAIAAELTTPVTAPIAVTVSAPDADGLVTFTGLVDPVRAATKYFFYGALNQTTVGTLARFQLEYNCGLATMAEHVGWLDAIGKRCVPATDAAGDPTFVPDTSSNQDIQGSQP